MTSAPRASSARGVVADHVVEQLHRTDHEALGAARLVGCRAVRVGIDVRARVVREGDESARRIDDPEHVRVVAGDRVGVERVLGDLLGVDALARGPQTVVVEEKMAGQGEVAGVGRQVVPLPGQGAADSANPRAGSV